MKYILMPLAFMLISSSSIYANKLYDKGYKQGLDKGTQQGASFESMQYGGIEPLKRYDFEEHTRPNSLQEAIQQAKLSPESNSTKEQKKIQEFTNGFNKGWEKGFSEGIQSVPRPERHFDERGMEILPS